jgi:hypothetical protein
MVQQNSDILSVNAVQPDALGGTDGTIYIVRVDSTLDDAAFAAKANDITKEIATHTTITEHWGVRFRSGHKEIGMSEDSYLTDHPEVSSVPAKGVTATPAPTAPANPRDSYAEQLVAISASLKVPGVVAAKSYDSLDGYLNVSITDPKNFEGIYKATTKALDDSKWKKRADFSLIMNLVSQSPDGILTPTGVSLQASIVINKIQTAGLSALLTYPESAVAMYNTLASVKGATYSSVEIGSRGVSESLDVHVNGPDFATAVYAATATVNTPDAQHVKVNVSN